MVDAARPRSATIEDVAAAAGVSRAAVSKVLRNAYGVSDSMRNRVSAAMTELEYRPRVAARAMRGRTYTIGIEIPDFGNQFFTRVLAGTTAALSDTAYQVVIAPAEHGLREGLRAIEALVDRQVDGLIVVSPRLEQSALERIARTTPLVMIGRHSPSEMYDTVAGDDAHGVDAAMSHLVELGHRQIAHLTLHESDPHEDGPHSVRLARYLETMALHGQADDDLVWRSDEGQESACAAVERALQSGSRATALFAAHDELALGAQRAIAELGAELSVVGYDDVPIASHPALGLTTVHQPGDLMGARAVHLLMERFEGRTVAAHEVFKPELRVRTSTRPPSLDG
ncbi:LacI family DNA-binding transcriptional regulator [Microbacterium trichothecenolyticum]|uniref:LacI family DNA-binding transcriptional regulator n=1 Tax=Microbacterium ureisolvens TaxID=2781186 RepID=A0ABS7I339_9MICO|nr:MULTISPECIES: LacI family DNA-binding transcriptional regulator [Microbacterium]MBW9111968.1 LacI family DNA-binding transcriptional regulator [Microbacterium ureisolvens]MBW9122423.1 LacI family DNA-binding transcriptional regulator [Microbacterium trichothecenolyticum]